MIWPPIVNSGKIKKPPPPKLPIRQFLFIDEYLVDFNASAAALRAGYSPKTAKSIGCSLLKKRQIKSRIAKRKGELRKKIKITQEYVAERLKKFESFDVRKLLDKDGNPLSIHKLDDETAKIIQGFEIVETIHGTGDNQYTSKRYKYKLVDRKSSNDSLSKLLGLNEPERKELSVEGLVVEIIQSFNDAENKNTS